MTDIVINLTPIDIDTLTQYFKDKNIKIRGTVNEPLFRAIDIAKKINDELSYTKNVSLEYIVKIKEGNKDVNYITEWGLYEYLLKSTKDEAVVFQKVVYNILVQVRKQIVNACELSRRLLDSMCAFDNGNINIDTRVDRGIAKYLKEFPTHMSYILKITEDDRNELKSLAEVGDQCIRSGIYNLVAKMNSNTKPTKTQTKKIAHYKLPDWM
jgi:DNA gyrase/topoisomerase IV subunit B